MNVGEEGGVFHGLCILHGSDLHASDVSLHKCEDRHYPESRNGHDHPLFSGLTGDSDHAAGSSKEKHDVENRLPQHRAEFDVEDVVQESFDYYEQDHQANPDEVGGLAFQEDACPEEICQGEDRTEKRNPKPVANRGCLGEA